MKRRAFLLATVGLAAGACATREKGASDVQLPPPPPGEAPNEAPLLVDELRRALGIGLATSWFKVDDPTRDYARDTVKAVRARGFTNLRLRSRADVFGFAEDRLDLASLERYLIAVERVVDDCLAEGVVPVVSWIHHKAEERARTVDGDNYVLFWTAVATRLRNKSHRLVFNLFTEIGEGKLRTSPDTYNDWTRRAVRAIRTSGGLNQTRILILGAPGKTAKSLSSVDAAIYRGDPYMMVEWHLFASGPNHGEGQKDWRGPTDPTSRANVDGPIAEALAFSKASGLQSYLGAWMPWDNIDGSLSQAEAESFADYFVAALKTAGIPWSLNELAHVYDQGARQWAAQREAGGKVMLVPPILERVLAAHAR